MKGAAENRPVAEKGESEMNMKPMMILPPGLMSDSDVKLLLDNGICVVLAKDPARVKFVDPIPAASSRTKIEDSAIKFSRKILRHGTYDDSSRGNFARIFLDFLVEGTPLDPNPLPAEREKEIFDTAKAEELRRLAREEAKAERLAEKAKIKAGQPPEK